MPLAQLLAGFQSLPLLPTSKLGPSGADSQVGRFVYVLGPVGLSNELSYDAGNFSHCHCNPPQVFTVRGFEALFPHAGTLGYMVCLAPQFLLVYPHANMGPPHLPAITLLQVLSALASHLCPFYQSE